MAGILRNGLRLIGATKNIKINTKNYHHVLNCFYNTVKNSIKQDQLYNQERKKNTKKQKISSKISNLNLIPGSGQMTLKIQKKDESFIDQLIFNNTADIKIKGNMPITLIHNVNKEKDQILESMSSENLLEKFYPSFDDGKLILKSGCGGTYTISQTTFIKADNIDLKNEYDAAKENNSIETQTLNIGKFNMTSDHAKLTRGDDDLIIDGNDDNCVIKELDENLKNAIGGTKETYYTKNLVEQSLFDLSFNLRHHSIKRTFKTLEGDESLSVHQIVEVRGKIPYVNRILQVAISKRDDLTDRCLVKVDSGYLMLENRAGDRAYIKNIIHVGISETKIGPSVYFIN